MRREKHTEKLKRMLASVDAHRLPVRVREFYVFGSYARGALHPGDLDVIVVHERPTDELLARWTGAYPHRYYIVEHLRLYDKFQAEMRKCLRRPGERIEIILTERLENWVNDEHFIRPCDLVLLWSEHDRNWQTKLANIVPDPAAGRAERDHFFSMNRLRTTLWDMEEVAELLKRDALRLLRIPANDTVCSLHAHEAELKFWTEKQFLGKKAIEVARYALWWLESQGQLLFDFPNELVFWSQDRTHRVQIGTPSPGWMVGIFESEEQVIRQCLIPYFKRGQPNELLVFERGPQWGVQKSTHDPRQPVLPFMQEPSENG